MNRTAVLRGALVLAAVASIVRAAPPPDTELPALVAGLPATLDRLTLRGPEAAAAIRKALAEAPAARKAVLTVALAAALNQEGDPKGAREALRSLPTDADAASADRAAFEEALAGEQSGDKNVIDRYEAAAAGKTEAVAGKALLRLAVLHKFAGRLADSRRALERAAKTADLRQRAGDAAAGLDRFAEVARNIPAAAIIAGPWRPRLMDTFAAPEVTFPTYGQFFKKGWMQIYSEADRPNRFPLGAYSGGGMVQAKNAIMEFAVRLRKIVHPEGKWNAGFTIRSGAGNRGVAVQYTDSHALNVIGPEDNLVVEAAVFRPRGINTFRAVAADRRVEIYLNGLPLEVIHDAPEPRGAIEFLALGCVSDYDWYKVLVPAPTDAATDNPKAWELNSAALDDAAAGRFEAAIAKLTELQALADPECESSVYLLRLIRSYGTQKHFDWLKERWPDKVAPQHLLIAEQTRLALLMRCSDPALREAFDESGKRFGERKYDEAIRLLDEVLAKSPGHLAALDARGEAYRMIGKFDKSSNDCEAALRTDPHSLMPLLRLATLARQQGEVAGEVKALERLVKAFPKFPEGPPMLEDARRRLNPRRPGGVQLT